jgi:hypothetical protein
MQEKTPNRELHYSTPVLVDYLNKLMEEMANAPKEDFGKRQPGERNTYEGRLRESQGSVEEG